MTQIFDISTLFISVACAFVISVWAVAAASSAPQSKPKPS